jgi:hypothetical protein
MVAKEQVQDVFVGDEAREALDQLAVRRLAFRSPITGRYHALSRLVEHLT